MTAVVGRADINKSRCPLEVLVNLGLQDETVNGYKSKWECKFQAFFERFDVLWCSRYERTSEGFTFILAMLKFDVEI